MLSGSSTARLPAMIYDAHSSALYADDGTFLHTVYCPMALTPDQLDALYPDSGDRHCHQCKRRIHRLDGLSDEQAKALFRADPRACIFSTEKARNIVFLHRREQREGNREGLPVIRTARNLPAMKAAHQQGFRLLLREVGTAPEEGEIKYIVYQHRHTGEIWWSSDLRDAYPIERWSDQDPEAWELVKNWFYARSDQPFPLAAYLIPKDLPPHTSVFIEDVIEDERLMSWNQGNSERIHATEGFWTGSALRLGSFEAAVEPPARTG